MSQRIRPTHSLLAKMTLLVILGTGLVLGFIVMFNYTVSKQFVMGEAERSAQDRARSLARELELELRAVEEITENQALNLSYVHVEEKTLLALIKGIVEHQREIYGSTVAFEPYAFSPSLKAFAPYFHKSDGGIRFVQLGSDTYNYFKQAWFVEPRERGKAVWSQPYFDEGGGDIIMTTYSYPFFDRNPDGTRGRFRGVVTADVSVTWLTQRLASAVDCRHGYCFLIARDGTFIAAPSADLVMRKTIFDMADELGQPKLRDVGVRMLQEPSGFVHVGSALRGTDSYLAFVHLPATGWSLGIVFPSSQLFAEVSRLHTFNMMLAAIGVVLLLFASLAVTGTVTSPLRRMVKATSQVAHGDLDIDLSEVKSSDEVGMLASAFTQMTVDLKKHIQQLQVTTAAKERIESELSVAAGIQRSMLPSRFPAFPGRTEFDVAAIMEPAKQVGGDLYDYLLTDPNRLYFTIADVSGKGVPAALFMAVTRFLIRGLAREGLNPGELLNRLNKELSQDNDSCMFVTVVCGVLEVDTGTVHYSNGGHEPGIILGPAGEITQLEKPDGPVIGVIENVAYAMHTRIMKPGETIFLFTDGVTEAQNRRDDQFSRERLLAACHGIGSKTVQGIVDEVLRQVTSFEDGADKADDLTMLAIRFQGRSR
ncbi:MAG: SpoIIE family protein phosphatase [Thermodesulfobacteriota bacterium]